MKMVESRYWCGARWNLGPDSGIRKLVLTECGRESDRKRGMVAELKAKLAVVRTRASCRWRSKRVLVNRERLDGRGVEFLRRV